MTKVSLLIVDDDASLRDILQVAAARTGIFSPIVTAPDGATAWDLLRSLPEKDRPELVVTDLAMPRMTGLELLNAIKHDPALHGIQVGIITSSDLPNDREEALAAGACAFLSKPMRLDGFVTSLLEIDACRQKMAA